MGSPQIPSGYKSVRFENMEKVWWVQVGLSYVVGRVSRRSRKRAIGSGGFEFSICVCTRRPNLKHYDEYWRILQSSIMFGILTIY